MRGRWKVVRTIWPYASGWGVYNPKTRTVLDTGIPFEQAAKICNDLNKLSPSFAGRVFGLFRWLKRLAFGR